MSNNGQIQAGIVAISPASARELLERNSHNRTINATRVALYAEDMRAGRWQTNGEAIIIAEDGTILDGQHRLMAIVKAGVTIRTMLVRGVKRETFKTIDQGRPRSLGDVLGIDGFKNRSMLASALRLAVWAHDEPRYAWGGLDNKKSSVGYLTDKLPEHDGLLHAVDVTSGLRKAVLAPSVVSFAIYMGRRYAAEHGPEAFWTRTTSGEGLEKGMPEIALRHWVEERHGLLYGSEQRMLLMACIMHAWNAHCRGDELQRMGGKIAENGRLPGFFGDGWYRRVSSAGRYAKRAT